MVFKNYRRIGFISALFLLVSECCLSVYGTEIIDENVNSPGTENVYSEESGYSNEEGEEYIGEVIYSDDEGGESAGEVEYYDEETDLTDSFPYEEITPVEDIAPAEQAVPDAAEEPGVVAEDDSEHDAELMSDTDDPGQIDSNEEVTVSSDGKIMRVSYINVGHGDSILIEYGGEAVLVDGGTKDKGRIVSDYIKGKGYKKLKMVIATHPHNDHVGGLSTVLSDFDCDGVISARSKEISLKNRGLTSDYSDFSEAVEKKGLAIEYPSKGTEYKIGLSDNKAVIKILETGKAGKNINNNSLVFMLTFGENRFLFVGDAENKEERDMIKSLGADELKCDVFKVGHHGKSDSSPKPFLDAISPEYAVISCDIKSKWRSPSKSVLKKLKNKGIQTFRTDRKGNIVAISDGKNITWNTTPEF